MTSGEHTAAVTEDVNGRQSHLMEITDVKSRRKEAQGGSGTVVPSSKLTVCYRSFCPFIDDLHWFTVYLLRMVMFHG